jgi:hypothetical protein
MARLGKFFYINGTDNLSNAHFLRVRADGGITESLGCIDTAGTLLESASYFMRPSGYKEDVVYSQIPINGNGDLSFTRASNGTRINSAGLVEVCPWNLLTYSEEFDNAAWTKFNVTASTNSLIAPNGTLTAENISVSSTTNDLRQDVSVSQNTQYTFSFYAKKDTISAPQYRVLNMTAVTDIIPRTSYGSVLISNEWVRVTLTFTTPSGCSLVRVQLLSNTNTSGNIGFWGAQLNEGATAKPYFPTTDRLNVPRLTYQNGGGGCPSLLLEKQSTNLALYSEEFDNASWSKANATITANSIISPSGTMTADKINEQAVNGYHIISSQNVTSGTYTSSVYVKKGERNFVMLWNNGTNSGRFFDLESGILGGTLGSTPLNSEIKNFGNGWFRCSITNNSVTSFSIYTAISSTLAFYLGETGKGLYIWGAQLEQDSYPTSYIPTTSASATRVADACSKTGISSLIGQTEGTLFIDFIKRPQTDTLAGYVCLKSNNNREVVVFWNNFSNVNTHFSIIANNAVIMNYNFGTLPNNENFKLATSYKSGETKVFKDGLLLTTLTNSFNFNEPLTNLELSSHYINRSVNESVNQVMVFPTALSDEELISLTTL